LEELKQRKIRDLLLKACHDIREQSNIPYSTRPSYTFVTEKGKIGFTVTQKGANCINQIVETLLKDKILGRRFSRKELRKEMDLLLNSLVKKDPMNIRDEISSSLAVTINKLKTVPDINWIVASPIVNLQVELSSSFEIGNVIFADKNSEVWNEIIKNIQRHNSKSDPFIGTIQEIYSQDTVAIAKVSALDQELAIDKGIQQIELAISILQFYGRRALSNDIISYRMYVGREGYLFQSQSSILALTQDNTNAQKIRGKFHSHKTGYLFPYVLTQKTVEIMRNLFFHRMQEILLKTETTRTPFERLLVSSITLFGLGINEYDQKGSFINFVISLESLLLREREPQRRLLAERVALILGKDAAQRLNIFNRMEELYQLRSDYVHRGRDNITESDIGVISYYAFNVIIKLISISERINDIGELIEKFSALKFGGPTFESVI
jgi:hypothetical protein